MVMMGVVIALTAFAILSLGDWKTTMLNARNPMLAPKVNATTTPAATTPTATPTPTTPTTPAAAPTKSPTTPTTTPAPAKKPTDTNKTGVLEQPTFTDKLTINTRTPVPATPAPTSTAGTSAQPATTVTKKDVPVEERILTIVLMNSIIFWQLVLIGIIMNLMIGKAKSFASELTNAAFDTDVAGDMMKEINNLAGNAAGIQDTGGKG
jgi:outer membrane biosynthesis protein TonB